MFSLHRCSSLLAFFFSLALSLTTAGAVDIDPITHQAVPGDFNGDGRVDALVQPLHSGGQGAILLRDGTGNLSVVAQGWDPGYLGLDWSADKSRITTADLNGDGRADVVIQPLAAGKNASVLITDPTAQLLQVTQVVPPEYLGLDWSAAGHFIIPGSFMGGAQKELLLQATAPGGVSAIVLPDQAGHLVSVGQSMQDGYLGRRWNAQDVTIYVGDFNGDGRQDLLMQVNAGAQTAGESTYALVLADQNGQFTQVNETWNGNDFGADWSPATHTLSLQDLNGTGVMDIVLTSKDPNGTNYVFVPNSQGEFTKPATQWQGPKSPRDALNAHRAPASNKAISVTVTPGSGTPPILKENRAAATAPLQTAQALGLGTVTPNTAGTLEGSAGVDGGNATYNIPIVVPPGRAGMQPQLTLSYSSGGGNGVVGMGWSLTGMSAIQRCPDTLVQDGFARGVSYDYSDRLCLNGKHLILVSGTYGRGGSVYRTELDTFVRIQLYNDIGLTTSYFVVSNKNHRTVYFSTPFTPAGAPAPLAWQITVEMDKALNDIVYTYDQSVPGESLIQEIDYTGQATSAGVPSVKGDRSVVFGYISRPDPGSSYLAGGLLSQTRLLSTITTNLGGLPNVNLRSYTLNYQTSGATGRSLLLNVQGCGVDSQQYQNCVAPTTFNWQQQAQTYQLITSYNLPDYDTTQVSQPTPTPSNPVTNFLPASISVGGDYNGDGRKELVYNRDGASHILFIDGDGNVQKDFDFTSLLPSPSSPEPFYWLQTLDKDINNDGAADLLVDDNGTLGVASWNGSAFVVADTNIPTTLATYTLVADMKGRGLNDIITEEQDSSTGHYCIYVYYNLNPKTLTFSARTQIADLTAMGTDAWGDRIDAGIPTMGPDLNGDGIPDILITERPGPNATGDVTNGSNFVAVLMSQVAANGAVTFNALRMPDYGVADATIVENDWFYLMDINGDGLPDLVFSDDYPSNWNGGNPSFHWFYQINTGKGFLPPQDTGVQDTRVADYDSGVWQQQVAKMFTIEADLNNNGTKELIFPKTHLAYYCPTVVVITAEHGTGAHKVCAGPLDGDYRQTLYDIAPSFDHSIFAYSSLQFVQQPDHSYTVVENDNTGIVAQGGFATVDDLQGDGLTSIFSPFTRFYYDAYWGTLADQLGDLTCPPGYPCRPSVSNNIRVTGAYDPNGYHTDAAPDMLLSATNGLGSTSSWDYLPLSTTQNGFYYAPPIGAANRYADSNDGFNDYVYFSSSMYVVSDYNQDNGLGGGSSDTHNFHYAQAIYNTRGRGFQGFYGIVDDDLVAGLRSVQLFHQRFPLSGLVSESWVEPIGETLDLTNLAVPSDNHYLDHATNVAACEVGQQAPWLQSQTPVYQMDGVTCTFGLDGPGFWPYNRRVTTVKQDANYNPLSTTVTDLSYDGHGNYTGGDSTATDATGSYSQTATDVYAMADTSANWWVDQLQSKTVITTTNYSTPLIASANGSITHAVNYDYYQDGTQRLKDEYADQGTGYEKDTAYGYDQYGNLQTQTISSPVALPGAYGTLSNTQDYGIAARTTTTNYNFEGYFPSQVIDALGHTTNINSVDPGTGLPMTVVDPNGLYSSYEYDFLGRKTVDIENPLPGTSFTFTAASAPGIGTCPSTAVYAINSRTPYNPRHTTCLDSLNRTVRSIVDGFTESDPTLVDTSYDSLGRTVETSEPYKSSVGGPQAWNVVNNYDTLSRPLKKTDPEGVVTTYSYTGLVTDITTTPLDSPWASGGPVRVDEETRNSLDKLLSVENGKGSGGTTDSLMQYRYDAQGDPVLIQDGNNNQIVATFNLVGQKIAVSDPDMGNWTYAYDVLGELLQQTDAKGNVMAQSYDLLGRLTTRTKPETAPAVTDTWTYDSCGYGIGKLCSLSQADGYAEAYTYDSFSRVVVDHAVVNGAAYNTLTTYDPFSGKVATTAYPASYPDTPPVPNAGPNQTVVLGSQSGTVTVTLNGSASTVTNTTYPARYTWTQTNCASNGGPAVQLSNPNAISPTFTASVVANYCFQLAVSDGFLAPTATVMVTVTPSAPGTLTLASDQGNGISYDGVFILNWGTAQGAYDFVVFRATDGVNFTAQTPTYLVQTATVGGGSTTADLTYTYKLQACAQNGICGPFGNTASVTVYYLPGVPPSINFPAYSNLDGTIPVSWATAGGVVTSYQVKLGEKNDGGAGGYLWVDGGCTATPPSTSCTIQYKYGTAGGYNYGEVYACNGPHCGGAIMAGNQVYIQQPAAPTLSGSGSTPTGNEPISWTAVTNANDYRLYQSLESSSSHSWGAYSLIYNGSATGTTISLGASSVAGQYYVLACVGTTGTNCTPASGTLTVSYLAPAAVIVTAPNPATTNVEPVNWTASSGATSYQLTARYTLLGGGTRGPTVIYSGGATSYSDAFPSTGTGGSYTVVACNTVGCSAVSNTASFTYNQLGGGGGGGGCRHCAVPKPPQSPRVAPPKAGSSGVPASSSGTKPVSPPSQDRQADVVHAATRNISLHGLVKPRHAAATTGRTAPLYAPPFYIAYAGAHLEPAAVTTVSARLTVQYQYTVTGYMQSQFNAIYPSQVFWTANTLDAFGQVTQQTYGNGVTSTITTNQDPLGRVTAIVTSTPNAAGNCNNSLVQNTTYSWYSVGDMKQRGWQSIPPGCGTPVNPSETFTYDVLNRLGSTTLNGTSAPQSTVNYTYDLMGNITSRSDAGTYGYAGSANAGPHAVTSVTSAQGVVTQYGYNPDGNMKTRGTTSVQWDDVYSLPTCIDAGGGSCTNTAAGANWSQFSYAPDKHRYSQNAYVNGVQETTVYLGNLEIVTIGGVSQFRHRLNAYGKDVLTLDWSSDGSLPKYNYEHDDNLGGVDAVTDASGAVIAGTAFGYDAFGQRRDPATGQVPQSGSKISADRSSTHRGFTNHEMLDNVGLVHMNGRVYDPLLGRFLSVDPMFQFPTNSQSVNPYSYVLNNPLSNADPTGYSCESATANPGDVTDCKDDKPTWVDIAAKLPNFFSCSGNCTFLTTIGNGQQNGRETASGQQTKVTIAADINSPQNSALNLSSSGTAPATSGQVTDPATADAEAAEVQKKLCGDCESIDGETVTNPNISVKYDKRTGAVALGAHLYFAEGGDQKDKVTQSIRSIWNAAAGEYNVSTTTVVDTSYHSGDIIVAIDPSITRSSATQGGPWMFLDPRTLGDASHEFGHNLGLPDGYGPVFKNGVEHDYIKPWVDPRSIMFRGNGVITSQDIYHVLQLHPPN